MFRRYPRSSVREQFLMGCSCLSVRPHYPLPIVETDCWQTMLSNGSNFWNRLLRNNELKVFPLLRDSALGQINSKTSYDATTTLDEVGARRN